MASTRRDKPTAPGPSLRGRLAAAPGHRTRHAGVSRRKWVGCICADLGVAVPVTNSALPPGGEALHVGVMPRPSATADVRGAIRPCRGAGRNSSSPRLQSRSGSKPPAWRKASTRTIMSPPQVGDLPGWTMPVDLEHRVVDRGFRMLSLLQPVTRPKDGSFSKAATPASSQPGTTSQSPSTN
jgi:hypothetical protein